MDSVNTPVPATLTLTGPSAKPVPAIVAHTSVIPSTVVIVIVASLVAPFNCIADYFIVLPTE